MSRNQILSLFAVLALTFVYRVSLGEQMLCICTLFSASLACLREGLEGRFYAYLRYSRPHWYVLGKAWIADLMHIYVILARFGMS